MSNPTPSGEAPVLQEETPLLFQQNMWGARIQDPAPLTEEEAERLKKLWMEKIVKDGFNPDNIRHVDGMVHVHLSPETHLHVSRSGVHVKGPVTDAAILAGLQHVKQAWGAVCYINPDLTADKKFLAWKMAQDAGVTIANYTPSKEQQAEYHDQKEAAARRAEIFGNTSPPSAAGPATLPTPTPPAGPAPAAPSAAAASQAAPEETAYERITIPPIHGPITAGFAPTAAAPRPSSRRPSGDIVTRTPPSRDGMSYSHRYAQGPTQPPAPI